jgi:hypothetical protein
MTLLSSPSLQQSHKKNTTIIIFAIFCNKAIEVEGDESCHLLLLLLLCNTTAEEGNNSLVLLPSSLQ